MVRSMNKDPVIFALADPMPEILPGDALQAGASIVGTGRNYFPNQTHYAFAFPGIFRGALDCQARDINEEMKLAAAYAIASCISDSELNEDYIIPGVFNPLVAQRVAEEVVKVAIKTGVARKGKIED